MVAKKKRTGVQKTKDKPQKKGKNQLKKKNTRISNARKPKAVTHKDFLSVLNKTRNRQKKNTLISIASRDQLEALSEVVENVLQGIIPLSEKQKKNLSEYRDLMRELCRRNTPLKEKRKKIQMSGGFLSAILPVALQGITSLLGGLFGNR